MSSNNGTQSSNRIVGTHTELKIKFMINIRKNTGVQIQENYTKGYHEEIKSETSRIMREYLILFKRHEKIGQVKTAIENIENQLQVTELVGVTFEADNQVAPPQARIEEPCIHPPFDDNVYQLLENTYCHVPESTWVCPYRKLELIQNKGNIIESLHQAKIEMDNCATRLNEFLSKLIKIKEQKFVFDFVANGLDEL